MTNTEYYVAGYPVVLPLYLSSMTAMARCVRLPLGFGSPQIAMGAMAILFFNVTFPILIGSNNQENGSFITCLLWFYEQTRAALLVA